MAPLFVDPANPKTDAAIEKYVAANQSLLSQPNMQLGGWLGDDGRYVIEVSQNYSDGKEAAQAAMDRNQNSYWDNAQGILNNAEAAVRSPDPSKPAVDDNGRYQDGTVQTPALQLSYGTGEFGNFGWNDFVPREFFGKKRRPIHAQRIEEFSLCGNGKTFAPYFLYNHAEQDTRGVGIKKGCAWFANEFS